MWSVASALLLIFLLRQLTIIQANAVSVGIIRNASLDIFGATKTTSNVTCDECVCSLLAELSFFSLNCRSDTLTCELHSTLDQNRPFNLLTAASTSFFFRSLPTFDDECINDITGLSTSTLSSMASSGEYFWTFDSTYQDRSFTFNGTPINNLTFSSSTITGYGSSLSFNASMNQSLSFDQPFLPLFKRSWTFEAWIYIPNLQSGVEYPVVGQCQSLNTSKCLHLTVRYARLHLGFYNDGLDGVTNLTASRWYHIAFLFNCTTRNQSVYLDGVLDATRQSNYTYRATNGCLTIGMSTVRSPTSYFNGLIDQFSYTKRSKTPDEILRDATLTLCVSFDDNSTDDQGPLRISGSLVGNTSFVSGRQGQALQIYDVPDSFFTMRGFVLLGTSSQPYSFSIWIKPTLLRKSSILHMSQSESGDGWCLPMIGLTDIGQLSTLSCGTSNIRVTGSLAPINSWTHVVATYSSAHGLQLYVNGSLYNASLPFSFLVAGSPTYLFVGSPRTGTSCGGSLGTNGQYSGAVDELRVYSRELSPADVFSLANS